MTERDNEVYIANLAEQAERFEDLVESMKKVCAINADLSVLERNLLSVGYKNMVGSRRRSWRILSAIEQKEEEEQDHNTENLMLIRTSRQKVEAELDDICKDVVDVIHSYLLPAARDAEAHAFYLKMKGDYSRYLAEVKAGEERKKHSEQAMEAYEEALGTARIELAPIHPVRLGIILNYAVFNYEIERDTHKACQLTELALEEATSDMDNLSEEWYKDSTVVMQLLRDNFTLWSADRPDRVKELLEAEGPTQHGKISAASPRAA